MRGGEVCVILFCNINSKKIVNKFTSRYYKQIYCILLSKDVRSVNVGSIEI